MKYEGLVGIYANCSTDILWVFMYPDISLDSVLLKDRGGLANYMGQGVRSP